MDSKKQKYSIEEFLDDRDFCSWARSERPDLDDYYRKLGETNSEQSDILKKAKEIVRLFDDEKIKTDSERKHQIWKDVNVAYQKDNKFRKLLKSSFKYAASIIVMAIIGSIFYLLLQTDIPRDVLTESSIQSYSQTSLLFCDGRKIEITDDRAEITYTKGGDQISINNKLLELNSPKIKQGFNQLIVPFGRQSKIILADSTEVWLNAGSHLIYPNKFVGKKRIVLLKGEAYFKVTKNKLKPFIVETEQSRIKVLGTSFNVKAYPDEKIEETVLEEGSVSVSCGKSLFSNDVVLVPNQRIAIKNVDHSYTILQANVEGYTSWIEGLFVFKEESLSAVLKRISRYYNIDIIWSDEVALKKISGKLDLRDDYRQVLNTVALISRGSYTIKGRRINFKLKNEK